MLGVGCGASHTLVNTSPELSAVLHPCAVSVVIPTTHSQFLLRVRYAFVMETHGHTMDNTSLHSSGSLSKSRIRAHSSRSGMRMSSR